MGVTKQYVGIALVFILLVGLAYVGWQSRGNRFFAATGSPQAQTGAPSAPVPIAYPFGTVTEKHAGEFTILGIGGKTVVVHTAAETQFLTDAGTGSISDLRVGTIVSISSSTPAADGSITALVVKILPPPPVPKRPQT